MTVPGAGSGTSCIRLQITLSSGTLSGANARRYSCHSSSSKGPMNAQWLRKHSPIGSSAAAPSARAGQADIAARSGWYTVRQNPNLRSNKKELACGDASS
jgi:hypothetical protein